MTRCEHCEYRNVWPCDDEYNRIRNDALCENFKLDFDTLSDGIKKQVQKRLLGILSLISLALMFI